MKTLHQLWCVGWVSFCFYGVWVCLTQTLRYTNHDQFFLWLAALVVLWHEGFKEIEKLKALRKAQKELPLIG